MLEKAIEILLGKFLQPRTRKQKADDDVKAKLVFLHECLVNCHNTYLQYISEPNDMNLVNWRQTVLELAYMLEEVALALSSFSPETFNYAADYMLDEVDLPGYDLEGESHELGRIVRRLALLRSGELPGLNDDDFKETTTRLREFMKEHMTVGEIQQAQEAFKRNTYWRHY
jgi:hypothetical protein